MEKTKAMRSVHRFLAPTGTTHSIHRRPESVVSIRKRSMEQRLSFRAKLPERRTTSRVAPFFKITCAVLFHLSSALGIFSAG